MPPAARRPNAFLCRPSLVALPSRPARPSRLTPVGRVTRLTLLALLVAGCGAFGTPEPAADPAQLPAATAAAKPKHVVQRGPITGVVRAPGRLVAGSEIPVSFSVGGRLRTVGVVAGDQVKAGDLLAELDAGALSRQIEEASLNLELATLKFEQARSRTVSDQDVLIARNTVERAESELQRSRERLAQLQNGPTPADLRAAELAVMTAEMARDDANTRLAAARRGARPEDLAAARGAVERARLALAAAEAEQTAAGQAAQRGLSPEAVALAKARADHEVARLTYEAKAAPAPLAVQDPLRLRALEAEVVAAEAAVERARRDHTAAEAEQTAQRPPGAPAPPNRIAEAKLAMQKADVDWDLARRRLELARTGPLPGERDANGQPRNAAAELAAAKAALDQAKLALDGAELAARAAAQRGTGLSPGEMKLAEARLAHQDAQAALSRLEAGPSEEEIAPLERAAVLAQASHETAAGRLEALRTPSERDVREAQVAVDRATADLQLVRADLAQRQAQLPQRRNELTLDLRVLERQVDRETRALAEARRALANTRLLAPAAGIVVTIDKKARDPVEEGEIVLVLAAQGQVLITANVTESEAALLSAGQQATVLVPTLAGRRFPATVADVGTTPLLQDGGNAIRITLRPQGDAADLRPGAASEVLFEGISREGIVLPKAAIRTNGTRRTVVLLERDREREIDVRTGLTSADGERVEITAGLREGDTVLLPST